MQSEQPSITLLGGKMPVWFQLIELVLKQLAWPTAALLIVWLLRGPLAELIRHTDVVERDNDGNLRIKFHKIVQAIQQALPAEISTIEGKVLNQEVYSPITEIMEAWIQIEERCRKLLARNGQPVPQTFRALGTRLKQHRLLDDKHADALDKLRQGRNLAVHGGLQSIDSTEAAQYLRLADEMIQFLDRRLSGD